MSLLRVSPALTSPANTLIVCVFPSLDRTNVVQSALAKWVLDNQLREIGVLSVKESVDEHAQFLNLFRNGKHFFSPFSSTPPFVSEKACSSDTDEENDVLYSVWADNADTVSKAYSGTGALKTDYTR